MISSFGKFGSIEVKEEDTRKIVRRLLKKSMLKLVSACSQEGEEKEVGEKYFGGCEKQILVNS